MTPGVTAVRADDLSSGRSSSGDRSKHTCPTPSCRSPAPGQSLHSQTSHLSMQTASLLTEKGKEAAGEAACESSGQHCGNPTGKVLPSQKLFPFAPGCSNKSRTSCISRRLAAPHR